MHYWLQLQIVETLHNELRQTFHAAFVSVAPLVFWDKVLRLLLGLLVFITVAKALKLFRYIKTFARLGNVYRRAARDIRAFAVSSKTIVFGHRLPDFMFVKSSKTWLFIKLCTFAENGID